MINQEMIPGGGISTYVSESGTTFMGMFTGNDAPATFLTIIGITAIVGLNAMTKDNTVKTEMKP